MPLANHLHEQFATLVAAGNTATGAYRTLKPTVACPHTLGAKLMKRPEVRDRIEGIRGAVSDRLVMSIAEKRDALRLMAEGKMATSIRLKDGTTLDILAAIVADAKLAGEYGRKPSATDPIIKFDFKVPDRNACLPTSSTL